jgi:hypothetical protein
VADANDDVDEMYGGGLTAIFADELKRIIFDLYSPGRFSQVADDLLYIMEPAEALTLSHLIGRLRAIQKRNPDREWMYFPTKKLAEKMKTNEQKTYLRLKRLKTLGVVVSVRAGLAKPNRIYLDIVRLHQLINQEKIKRGEPVVSSITSYGTLSITRNGSLILKNPYREDKSSSPPPVGEERNGDSMGFFVNKTAQGKYSQTDMTNAAQLRAGLVAAGKRQGYSPKKWADEFRLLKVRDDSVTDSVIKEVLDWYCPRAKKIKPLVCRAKDFCNPKIFQWIRDQYEREKVKSVPIRVESRTLADPYRHWKWPGASTDDLERFVQTTNDNLLKLWKRIKSFAAKNPEHVKRNGLLWSAGPVVRLAHHLRNRFKPAGTLDTWVRRVHSVCNHFKNGNLVAMAYDGKPDNKEMTKIAYQWCAEHGTKPETWDALTKELDDEG